MAERGHGAIVNVSTMVVEFGMSGMALYGSSKAALELLTKWSDLEVLRGLSRSGKNLGEAVPLFMLADPGQQCRQILPSELPLERSRGGVVALLELH
jgi:hypothetical protein